MRDSTRKMLEAAMAAYVVNETPLTADDEPKVVLGKMIAEYVQESGADVMDICIVALDACGWPDFASKMEREWHELRERILREGA